MLSDSVVLLSQLIARAIFDTTAGVHITAYTGFLFRCSPTPNSVMNPAKCTATRSTDKGDKINERALRALIKAAVQLNTAGRV